MIIELMTPRLVEVFWSRVAKTSGCWVWTGGFDQDGYGYFHINRRQYKAHRIAYELQYGTLDADSVVMHDCDNPACQRHLRQGSHRDNSNDKVDKGRHAKGEMYSSATLTDDNVREIRRLYRETPLTQLAIARLFNVSQGTVAHILKGRNWTHVN